MLWKMAAVVVECVRKPGEWSVWSERAGRYVCPDEPQYQVAIAEQAKEKPGAITPKFKLVFITAAVGTVFFFVTCVTVHLVIGKEMSDPLTQIIDKTFDLVKIGFGTLVGMAGAKALE